METPAEAGTCRVRGALCETEAVARLGHALRTFLARFRARQPVVVLCIGTDRSTGDALGPLTGHELLARGYPPGLVYGTVDEPVHAGNLLNALARVRGDHPGALILAVDACLGTPDNVGSISLSEGPVRPGAGVNKSLPDVGELALTGVVNVAGFMEYFVLQNTRLSLVMRMARVMAQGIMAAGAARHWDGKRTAASEPPGIEVLAVAPAACGDDSGPPGGPPLLS